MDIWVEKHRPRELNQVVLDILHQRLFQSFLDKGEIPHLMFAGGPGTGKTTVAKILIDKLGAECLELNASDERGIGTIRDKVKSFLMTEVLVGRKFKIVFLDEADYLTPDAFAILRRLLEDHADTGKVIFSINYLSKVPEAIVSRCQLVAFKPVKARRMVRLFQSILEAEGKKSDPDQLLMLAEDCRGDLRKAVGILQRDSVGESFDYSGEVIGFNLDNFLLLAKTKCWDKMYTVATDLVDFQEVYRLLFDKYWGKNEKAIGIVGEFMYRDSAVFDRGLNLLTCISELLKYGCL